ncbi:uncharacterized protein CLUP02_17436 [Colletotrichum lupini]|uniref:Uncharacterized protein n=1 Tax=Colletotrichum lupini TaxID=145971 RepID=A0A9Q8SEI3_9PEZI|nr:uncharacterized protein CLUP02_17436 [Colletotrichum lupini]UQC75927.1 hypothetical protein CLUP02_17436 [Colletotrichum lupini]
MRTRSASIFFHFHVFLLYNTYSKTRASKSLHLLLAIVKQLRRESWISYDIRLRRPVLEEICQVGWHHHSSTFGIIVQNRRSALEWSKRRLV